MKEEQALEAFLQRLQKPTPQEPAKQLDEAFYALLENEKRKGNPTIAVIRPLWQRGLFKYAVAMAGLVGAFWVGRVTNNAPAVDNAPKIVYVPQQVVRERVVEIPNRRALNPVPSMPTQVATNQSLDMAEAIATLRQEMRDVQANQEKMMLSLLQRDSPADRIEGLQYSYDINQPAPAVLAALVKTLDNDPNINVRMAAADAVGQFSSQRVVREALIKSLLKQDEPAIQIAVMKLLTQVRERRALPALQQMAQDSQLNDFVKLEVEKSIDLLTD